MGSITSRPLYLLAVTVVVASLLTGCSDGTKTQDPGSAMDDNGRVTTPSDAQATGPSEDADPSTGGVPSAADDPRGALGARLAQELGDPTDATRLVQAMDDAAVDAAVSLADGDVAASPWLSYRPSTVPADEIDSLWVFSYGYRFADPDSPPDTAGGAVPAPEDLVPGPVNEALAEVVERFVAKHPMPVVAQWEIAGLLSAAGVPDVISVDPVRNADGSVTYLSTAGVVEEGTRLLVATGREPGHTGVMCFELHAVRCLLTMRAAGLTADVPAWVDLPSTFDPQSGQAWTRSPDAWIPLDLAGRSLLKG